MAKKTTNEEKINSEILLTRIINKTIKLEDLSQEELIFSLSHLVTLYNNTITNVNKISYNNELQVIKNNLVDANLKIEDYKSKIHNLSNKMQKPLSLSERLKGRLDLKKMTIG